jgi:hypothetical protein
MCHLLSTKLHLREGREGSLSKSKPSHVHLEFQNVHRCRENEVEAFGQVRSTKHDKASRQLSYMFVRNHFPKTQNHRCELVRTRCRLSDSSYNIQLCGVVPQQRQIQEMSSQELHSYAFSSYPAVAAEVLHHVRTFLSQCPYLKLFYSLSQCLHQEDLPVQPRVCQVYLLRVQKQNQIHLLRPDHFVCVCVCVCM